jgi:16S rRNA (adenine1518-N6/adenine1519-N6)-dimethyltransferase
LRSPNQSQLFIAIDLLLVICREKSRLFYDTQVKPFIQNTLQKTKHKNQRPKFAKKSLGQNFLVDENYVQKIISALNPQVGETIIEIGPGRGALTKYLVESGANVIAIELDRDLVPLLQKEFADYKNFQIIEQDALTIDFSAFRIPHSAFRIKLVANLPYYISTAILQRLIEQNQVFSELILMLQREVVERITAQVGNSERGFLTVLVEQYFHAEKLFDVSPQAFRPIPKVWSSIVSLTNKNSENVADQRFRQLVSFGFRQKRKTILNNLKQNFENINEILEVCKVDSNRRAETLTLEEWRNLFEKLVEN